MPEPEEITQGYEGFDPTEYEVECAACEKKISLLGNHVRGFAVVERHIPFFQPEQFNGATSGRVAGRPEAEGVYCNFDCFADALKAHGEKHGTKMFAHVEGDFPYGEDTEEYQDSSAAHNVEIRGALLKQIRETLPSK